MSETRPEWIRCIAHTHVERKGTAWCGKQCDSWSFVDIDHAAYNGQQKGRLVACVDCVKTIAAALCEPGREGR